MGEETILGKGYEIVLDLEVGYRVLALLAELA